MIICLLCGVAIGAWQGFWIAYVRIPPFIVTLAGMLLFRGLAQAILGGTTISGFSDKYLAIFNNYVNIPALDSGTMKYSAIIFGILCCLVFIIASVTTNLNKKRKGYTAEKPVSLYSKILVICAIVMLLMYKLSLYKGVPYILLWLIGIVAIYTYITAKTTFGRHFYALGGNEKATKLSGINTNRIYFSAPTMSSMPSAPASSAAHPLTAASAKSAAWSSARCSWACSTLA